MHPSSRPDHGGGRAQLPVASRRSVVGAWVAGLEHVRICRCPACGQSIRFDDAIGLLRWHPAHAECVIARWTWRHR